MSQRGDALGYFSFLLFTLLAPGWPQVECRREIVNLAWDLNLKLQRVEGSFLITNLWSQDHAGPGP